MFLGEAIVTVSPSCPMVAFAIDAAYTRIPSARTAFLACATLPRPMAYPSYASLGAHLIRPNAMLPRTSTPCRVPPSSSGRMGIETCSPSAKRTATLSPYKIFREGVINRAMATASSGAPSDGYGQTLPSATLWRETLPSERLLVPP